MLANQRRDKILDLLKEDGSAKVIDLARLFKVTEVTIRQDLEKLEKEGWVYRAPDPVDRRRSWLILSERALNVMRDYLAGLSVRPRQGLDFP